MSPAHVLEPTYDGIRRRIIAGVWPPGQRLEAARLADELGVSITPVRDSLNRLTGERLVQSHAGDGFHVPRLSEADFRGLIDWHEQLLDIALRRKGTRALPQPPAGHDGIADWTALLFATIATAARLFELNANLANVAARLGPYRNTEPAYIADVGTELLGIEDTMRAGDLEGLRERIARYHSRRRATADRVIDAVRAAPRYGPD